MRRYSLTKTKIDKSGVEVYKTTYYPIIEIQDSDDFIFAKVGDRVDTLAHKYYGDTTLWWIIAKANGIKGKIALEPGQLLRIPRDATQILEKFEDLNESDGDESSSGGSSGGGY